MSDEEDIVNHGDDMGLAAYATEGTDFCSQPACSSPVAPAAAQAKEAQLAAPALRSSFVVASLNGIEDRLSDMGERPAFREAGPGKLQHECTTIAATVCFWPGSLKWCVEGKESRYVEDVMLGVAASSPAACSAHPGTHVAAAHTAPACARMPGA